MKERLKDKMSIKKRLITIELISILGMIAIGLVAIVTSVSINQASTDIAKYWAPAVIAAEELNTHTSDYRIAEHNHALSEQKDDMKAMEEEILKERQLIDQAFENYMNHYARGGEADLIYQARKAWDQYLVCSDEILEISRKNQPEEALKLLQGESKELFDEASLILKELAENNQAGVEASSEYGNYLYRRLIGWKIVMILFLGAALSVFVISLIRGIAVPIGNIVDGVTRLAAGNLDVHLELSGDKEMQEVEKAVNLLSDNLKTMTTDQKKLLNEIGRGNLTVSSKRENAYHGDFASILYEMKGLETRLQERESQSHAKETDN